MLVGPSGHDVSSAITKQPQTRAHLKDRGARGQVRSKGFPCKGTVSHHWGRMHPCGTTADINTGLFLFDIEQDPKAQPVFPALQ